MTDDASTQGRLRARPGRRPLALLPPGAHPIGLGAGRDGLIVVPPGLTPERPAPVLVMLHGAGSDAARGVRHVRDLAAAHGVVLLAPDSRERTWDIILGDYGPDVAFLDAALARLFEGLDADPVRVAIGGFSDGASYALSLGMMNGDLFTHVLAFSPGFMLPIACEGRPRIFVSHGTRDPVLPIARCSRQLVPVLAGSGYDVTWREFDGGHEVPPPIAAEAMAWFAG